MADQWVAWFTVVVKEWNTKGSSQKRWVAASIKNHTNTAFSAPRSFFEGACLVGEDMND
jgi:hypothetical protein